MFTPGIHHRGRVGERVFTWEWTTAPVFNSDDAEPMDCTGFLLGSRTRRIPGSAHGTVNTESLCDTLRKLYNNGMVGGAERREIASDFVRP